MAKIDLLDEAIEPSSIDRGVTEIFWTHTKGSVYLEGGGFSDYLGKRSKSLIFDERKRRSCEVIRGDFAHIVIYNPEGPIFKAIA